MTGMLELSNFECNITMINILRELMNEIKSMKEQMRNIRKKKEILRKRNNKKKKKK
jgi:hypothetical protein